MTLTILKENIHSKSLTIPCELLGKVLPAINHVL